VELASGETDHVWIDAITFLEVRLDRPSYGPAGTPPTVSMFYRDYKPVEDLQIPMVIETAGGPGAPPDKLVIDRVFVNTLVDDRAFAQPGAREPRGGAAMGQSPRAPTAGMQLPSSVTPGPYPFKRRLPAQTASPPDAASSAAPAPAPAPPAAASAPPVQPN
jgi:hypothetical protein